MIYGTINFFGNLLITVRHYYYAKYKFLTSLIWLIFSDSYYIAQYWNSDCIKLLALSVYVKHSLFKVLELYIIYVY